MKNLTKMRRLFFSVVLAVLSVLLLVNALPNKVGADDASAIYNGTVTNLDPNDNSSRTANGLIHKIWMTAKNNSGQTESSNYGTAQPGVTHNFLLEKGNYQDLYLHLRLTNQSENDPITIHNEMLNLPISHNFLGDANSHIVYGDTKPVSNPDNASIWYDFADGRNGTDHPDSGWDQIFAISIKAGNVIPAGGSIQIDVPLKVIPDANGNVGKFTFADYSYNASAVYTSIQNWARVASPVELNYRQPGYEGYFIAGTSSNRDPGHPSTLNFANNAQKYFPQITKSLNAIGYDNTNSFVDKAGLDNVFYTDGLQVVQLDAIPSATGKGTLADDLHNNGYSFLIPSVDYRWGFKANQEAKDYVYSVANSSPLADVKMPDGSGATGQMYDNKLLGSITLQVQQLLDASDRTIPVTKDGAWAPYDGVTFYGIDQSKLDKNPDGASYVVKKVDSNNNESAAPGNKVDTTKDGVYHVTYTYEVYDGLTVKKTITITVGKGNPTPPTTGTSNNGGTNTSNTNNNNNNSNNGNNSGNTNGSTTTTTKPSTSVGPNIAVKGEAVYAIKKIGLYRSTSFTKKLSKIS